MGRMTKETAKLAHLKARRHVLEEQLTDAAMNEDYEEFSKLMRDMDTIDFRIEVQENYLNEGFNTRVKNTITVPSSIGKHIPLL